MNEWQKVGSRIVAPNGRKWVESTRSNFRALRQLEGVFDVDA